VKNKPGSDLLPDGEYNATIVDGIEGVSQNSGNEMITLTLEVYGPDSVSYAVTDYLPAISKMQWKIRHLCESTGVNYEQEDLPVSLFLGKNVRVAVVKLNDKKYGWQNRVNDYIGSAVGSSVKPAAADDDIPF
jgi:Protein of unknown function (DUF669)